MKTKKFTKQELHKIHFRWIWQSQIGWNYERMQGLGYLSTVLPMIEKLYGDNPELKDKALKVHSQFFNTQPAMGDMILGIDVAIEEQNPTAVGIETAAAVKTALMGPFAGIGDTIFGMIAGAVFGSIAASMAVEGSAIGIAIWTVWYACVLFLIRPRLFDMGYTQGMTVVGAMIATMVKFPLATITVKIGTDADGSDLLKEFPLMTYANSIMPALFPALLAALCYWLLGQKWMNSNKLIIAVVVLAIVLRVLGVLA